MTNKKLWLWKNGEKEYWAFESLYPTLENGDPAVLGEPVGYALMKVQPTQNNAECQHDKGIVICGKGRKCCTCDKILPENNADSELVKAAKEILHLHLCEQEGLSSGQPTREQWLKAVDGLSEALTSQPITTKEGV